MNEISKMVDPNKVIELVKVFIISGTAIGLGAMILDAAKENIDICLKYKEFEANAKKISK